MAHSKSEIKKAKNLLNKYALKGEQLAFINSKEAKLLKKMGGAGKMTKAGIRSYTEDEEDTGDVSNSGSSSSPSNDGGSGDNDNNFNASAARFTPTQPKSMLSRIGSGIVNYIKSGGLIGMGLTAIGKGLGKSTTSYNPMNIQPRNKPITGGGGGGKDTPPAMNVGGRIVKLSPTTAEVSQSGATDASPYDNRKTKARGRSMTILTSARGVRGNTGAVLGTKSLLGA
jgi:hypothetical protein